MSTLLHGLQSGIDARREIRGALAGWDPECVEIAVLLTSEIVANALVHTDGDSALTISVNSGNVRVEVVDAGHHVDLAPLTVDSSAAHGRGLMILDRLADEWGIDERPPGKAVWFTLARPCPGTARPSVAT